jgi:hypothetical protein
MDELVILCTVRKGIDPGLVDGEPFRGLKDSACKALNLVDI